MEVKYQALVLVGVEIGRLRTLSLSVSVSGSVACPRPHLCRCLSCCLYFIYLHFLLPNRSKEQTKKAGFISLEPCELFAARPPVYFAAALPAVPREHATASETPTLSTGHLPAPGGQCSETPTHSQQVTCPHPVAALPADPAGQRKNSVKETRFEPWGCAACRPSLRVVCRHVQAQAGPRGRNPEAGILRGIRGCRQTCGVPSRPGPGGAA